LRISLRKIITNMDRFQDGDGTGLATNGRRWGTSRRSGRSPAKVRAKARSGISRS